MSSNITKSLSTICLDSIVDGVMKSPPMIRDMIAEGVSNKITNEKKERIRQNTISETCQINDMLIPNIVQYIIESKFTLDLTINDRNHIREKYKKIEPNILETAIDIAESTLSITRHLDGHFRLTWGNYDELSESSDSNSDMGDY
jgi:hypothetical protein